MFRTVSGSGLITPGFAVNKSVFVVILESIWTVARARLFAVSLNEGRGDALFWITSKVIVDISLGAGFITICVRIC